MLPTTSRRLAGSQTIIIRRRLPPSAAEISYFPSETAEELNIATKNGENNRKMIIWDPCLLSKTSYWPKSSKSSINIVRLFSSSSPTSQKQRQNQSKSNRGRARKSPAAARQQKNSRLERQLYHQASIVCDDTQTPYGSFTNQHWDDSLQVLYQLTSSLRTLACLEASYMVMERLVIEQTHSIVGNDASKNRVFLETKHLNWVVNHWKHCWMERATRNTNENNNNTSQKPQDYTIILTPSQMVSLMDDWLYRLDHHATAMQPNVHTYNSILQAVTCTTSITDQSHIKAFVGSMYQRMMQEADDHSSKEISFRPDTETYKIIIPFMTQMRDIQAAEYYWKQMTLEYARGNTQVQPTQFLATELLKAYAALAGPEKDPFYNIPVQAEALLRNMQHMSESQALENARPNRSMYNVLLRCWVRSLGHPQAYDRAIQIYKEMRAQTDVNLQPDADTLMQVLKVFVKPGQGDQAQELFDDYLSQDRLNPLSKEEIGLSLKPPDSSQSPFSAVLLAWEASGDPNTIPRMESLLQRMKDFGHKPNLASYTSYLGALLKQRPETIKPKSSQSSSQKKAIRQSLQKAEALVGEMESFAAKGDKTVKPDTYTYNLLINAHATMGRDPFQAEAVLEHMYEVHLSDNKDTRSCPDITSFNTVLKAWAESSNPSGPERSDAILRRMWKLHHNGTLPEVRPNDVSYVSVMSCHARSRQPGAARRCQELLDDMQQHGIEPTQQAWSACIYAQARLGRPEQAELVFQRAVEHCRRRQNAYSPNKLELHLLNPILKAWAESGRPNAGERAQQIMENMREQYKAGVLADPPDRISYLGLIRSWISSNHREAIRKVEAIVDEMESATQAGTKEVKPNYVVYNALLEVYMKDGRPRKADTLLQKQIDAYMASGDEDIKPDQFSFQCVLAAWAGSEEESAPDRAEAWLNRLYEIRDSGSIDDVGPDSHCLRSVLKCLARQKRKHGIVFRMGSMLQMHQTIADRVCYNMVINSHAELGNAKQAETLLRSMQEQGRQGKTDVVPDNVTFNTLMKALSNSEEEDKSQRADTLLTEMDDMHKRDDYPIPIKPTQYSFVMAMNCHINSNSKDALQRVEALCNEIIKRFDNGEEDLRFDTHCLNALLKAYSTNGEPRKAQDLLDQLFDQINKGQNSNHRFVINADLTQNAVDSVIFAWLRANEVDMAQEVIYQTARLREAGKSNVVPRIQAYLSVLRCWDRSGLPETGERMDDLLRLMEADKSSVGAEVIHNKGLYLVVMRHLSQAGNGSRASALLSRAQSLLSTTTNHKRSFTDLDLFLHREAIEAWKNSGDAQAPQKIRVLEGEIANKLPKAKNHIKY